MATKNIVMSIDIEKFDTELNNLSSVESQLKGKIGNHNVCTGMLLINTACCGGHSDPQFRIYNKEFNPNGAIEEGLVLLHKGFLDHDLPLKAGNELRTASSVFNNISLVCEDAQNYIAPIPALAINKAEKIFYQRMNRMMRAIAKGFEAVGNISFIKEAGNGDASELAMSLLRNASLTSISWARVYNSEDAYVKNKVLSKTEHFRSMSDEKKFGILLNGNEFLRTD
jgi:hypothetical protein